MTTQELPAADFRLDGGALRCYYADTVAKLIENAADEIERLRAVIEFVLPMAEEEWGHHQCQTNGLKAVEMMREVLTPPGSGLVEKTT